MHELLVEMGFPLEFRELMSAIYKDLKVRIKVNGEVGAPIKATNGVRQGGPASPLIFNLVMEALLISIREEMAGRGCCCWNKQDA